MGDGLDGVSEEFLEQFIRGQDYEFTPASVHTMKEKWIENQLRARAKEFTKYKPIHLAIGLLLLGPPPFLLQPKVSTPSQNTPKGTYNVNGKFPKSETGDVLDLSDWLRFPEESSPDIFVIGYVERTPLPTHTHTDPRLTPHAALYLATHAAIDLALRAPLPPSRFQELDLSAEAFVFNNSTLEDDWARAIEAAFCPSVAYWKVGLAVALVACESPIT